MNQELDVNLLEALQPQKIKLYLESCGWIEHDLIEDKASIFTLDSNEGSHFEVIVPLKKELKDYSFNIFNLIKTLEIVEKKKDIDLIYDLFNCSSDILQIRLSTHKTTYGQLPFNEGIKFYDSVKKLILSSAKATIKPEAFYENLPPQVDRYLETLQMGHKKGSYILDVISPIEISDIQQTVLNFGEDLKNTNESFGRKSMKQLAISLQIIKKVAEEVSNNKVDIGAFNETVKKGISANLCDAIVGIDRSGECNGVDIKFNWSPIVRIEDGYPKSIFISREIVPVIESAAELLKSLYREDFELRGVVINLHRMPDSRTGKVIVRTNALDNRVREVSMQLQDADYELAVQAHQCQNEINCRGELLKEGKSYKLLNPRRLYLLTS
jgi:hypothetical protein